MANARIPSPQDFGWTLNEDQKWSPVLTVASKACEML